MPKRGAGRSGHRGDDNDEGLAMSKKLRTSIDAGPTLDSDPIKVLVGADEEKFYIHEHILNEHSEFFVKALNKQWKEGNEKLVRLPEVEVTAFRVFAKWVYSGRFFCTEDNDEYEEDGIHHYKRWGKLFECYELGDFLQAPGFNDAIIDVITDTGVLRNETPVHISSVIYFLTTPGSPHRQLCCNIAMHCSRQLFVSMRDRDLPREFLEDVLIEVGTVLDRGVKEVSFAKLMEDKTSCEYHEHTRSNTPCYKTKFGD